MLDAQKLEKLLWAEAVVNVVYTLNRSATKALKSITPEEMWSGRRPCVAHMRVFGNLAYTTDPNEKRFNAKETKCMFVGYCKDIEAYRLMCLETKRIIKSGNVAFMEDNKSMINKLELHPNGRDGGCTVVLMDKSSKSPLLDGDKQTMEDVERVACNGVAIEEPHEKLANKGVSVENCGGVR